MGRRSLGCSIGAVVLLALGLGACGDDDDGGGVGVTLRDFAIELDDTSAPAGEVTFDVHNDGPSIHEFVVFKSDLAPDALPTDDEGLVEEGESFEPIDEIEDIADGADHELTIDAEAGDYVLICNLPGHYAQGMAVGFTVE